MGFAKIPEDVAKQGENHHRQCEPMAPDLAAIMQAPKERSAIKTRPSRVIKIKFATNVKAPVGKHLKAGGGPKAVFEDIQRLILNLTESHPDVAKGAVDSVKEARRRAVGDSEFQTELERVRMKLWLIADAARRKTKRKINKKL